MPPWALTSWMRLRINDFLNRLAVDLLHQRHELVLAHSGDAVKNGVRIFVTGLYAFEVDHAESAQLRQLHGHANVHNAIHGAGDDRNLAVDSPEAPAGVGHFRINGPAAGHQGDFVDAVGPTYNL